MEKIYRGRIKSINKGFGFIKYDLGDIFYHKSGLLDGYYPKKNDDVEFRIKPSLKKPETNDAYDIKFIKNELDSISEKKYFLGKIKWFDRSNGFGFIESSQGDVYVNREGLSTNQKNIDREIVVFRIKTNKKRKSAENCQLFDQAILTDILVNKREIIEEYIRKYKGIGNIAHLSQYYTITSIFNPQNIDTTIRDNYFDVIYNMSSMNIKSKFLLDGYVILNEEQQKTLLSSLFSEIILIDSDTRYKNVLPYLRSTYIEQNIKEHFSLSLYNKSNLNFKAMFMSDGLINLSEYEQILLIEQYIETLSRSSNNWNYEEIKKIAESEYISSKIRNDFIHKASDIAKPIFKHKIYFEDKLIELDTVEKQSKYINSIIEGFKSLSRYSQYLIIKSISESDSINQDLKHTVIKSYIINAKGEYLYEAIFVDNIFDISKETKESQSEILSIYLKFIKKIDEGYNGKYNTILVINNSSKIDEVVKRIFCERAYSISSIESRIKMIVIDNLIDIERYTQEDKLLMLQDLIFNVISLGPNRTNYNKLISLLKIDKVNKYIQKELLRFVIDKLDPSYFYFRHRLIFDDRLIEIDENSREKQLEIANIYLKGMVNIGQYEYALIKSIKDYTIISDSIKDLFLTEAYDLVSARMKFNMMLKDNLIDIENKNKQLLLMTKYLLRTVSHQVCKY